MTPTASTFDLAIIWLIAGWAVVALGAVLLAWALFRDRSRGRRRCPKCWYDMAGAPSLKCPECGREAKNDRALFRTRRKWGWAVVAVVFVAAGYTSTRVPSALKDGVISAVPTPALRFAAWCRQDRARALYESATTGGAGFGNMGWGGPTRGGSLSADWDAVLIAWYAGKQIEKEAGRSHGDAKAWPNAVLQPFHIVRNAGAAWRVAKPELLRAIESDFWSLAIDQFAWLALSGDAGSVDILESVALRDRRPEPRVHAAGKLTAVAGTDDRDFERVRRVLASEHGPEVAWVIANVLAGRLDGRGASKPLDAGEALMNEMLHDERTRVRLGGLSAVRRMKDWSRVEQSLADMLCRDPSATIRHRVAEAARSGPPLSSVWGLPLVRACEDEDPNVRRAATETLLHWSATPQWPKGQFESWIALREAEDPRESGHQRDALKWVLSLKNWESEESDSIRIVRHLHRFAHDRPELLPMYLSWARHHVIPVARIAAIEAIPRVPSVTSDVAIDLLESVISAEPNMWVRIAAMRELSVLAADRPRVLEVLAIQLSATERDTRMMAALMLGVLAKPHERAQSRLEELARESDVGLAQIAKSSLEAMRSGTSNSTEIPRGPVAAPHAPSNDE